MRTLLFKYIEILVELLYFSVMIYWCITNSGEEVFINNLKNNYIVRWFHVQYNKLTKNLRGANIYLFR